MNHPIEHLADYTLVLRQYAQHLCIEIHRAIRILEDVREYPTWQQGRTRELSDSAAFGVVSVKQSGVVTLELNRVFSHVAWRTFAHRGEAQTFARVVERAYDLAFQVYADRGLELAADLDPSHDPAYVQHVEESARFCRCCSCCRDVPCAGALAGGMCDSRSCALDRDPDELGYDHGEDDEADHLP